MHPEHPSAASATDPICGMTVDIATAEFSASHSGETYYFCGAGCRKAFALNPDAFVGADAERS